MVSQKLTTLIGYNRTKDGKRISLMGLATPFQKITECSAALLESFSKTELIASMTQVSAALLLQL